MRAAGSRESRTAGFFTGHGTFVDDVQRPGMLHACFVRSPFAHATINGIDASEALALPGVHAVFTPADLNPEVKPAGRSIVKRPTWIRRGLGVSCSRAVPGRTG